MQREDPRCLALEEINAARLSSPQAMAAHAVPFNYVAPKVKARPRLPRVPPPGDRVFPKHAPQGYSFVSGPAPLTWSETTRSDLTFPWEAPAFAPIFAQRAIELQAVPSIQSLQPPSYWGPVLPSYWMRHSRAQQPSASLTFWRGSLRSSSFESLPSPPCVRAPYGTH